MAQRLRYFMTNVGANTSEELKRQKKVLRRKKKIRNSYKTLLKKNCRNFSNQMRGIKTKRHDSYFCLRILLHSGR